ncbi:hypothetical protein T265_05542 [Opisthorchis viverrini]|uniref:Uncharacterized protein n=1 Tax=Opisthorchis viverrini TaxID=6198 RepID=A0A074ZK63_OPIVI|nr:hypothetical protein T265_05542 [Opisthorchis viverrini]KER27441.1 hypothetical protein T265_05542 [Opisthorchis viverrini]
MQKEINVFILLGLLLPVTECDWYAKLPNTEELYFESQSTKKDIKFFQEERFGRDLNKKTTVCSKKLLDLKKTFIRIKFLSQSTVFLANVHAKLNTGHLLKNWKKPAPVHLVGFTQMGTSVIWQVSSKFVSRPVDLHFLQ